MTLSHHPLSTPARSTGAVILLFAGLLPLLLPINSGAQVTPVVLSFTNSTPITIYSGNSDSSPFPSSISVPALPGTIQDVSATLLGLCDAQCYSIELLLMNPSSQGIALMSSSGLGLVTNAIVTFDDSGAYMPLGFIGSTTYLPAGATGGSFPYYSPFFGEATTSHMAGLLGTSPTGSWGLYEFYMDYYPNGSITGGWSLNFTIIPDPPLVANLAAAPVTFTNATLNANVSPGGAPSSVFFQYGLNTSYGNFSDTNTLADDVIDTQEVSLPVSGLLPGTTYHFQAIASNEAGTNYGGDMTFTTPSVAPELTISVTNATNLVLIVQGVPGSNYVIQSTTSLSPPINWTTVTNFTLTNMVEYILVGPVPTQQVYYRLEPASPPPPTLLISSSPGPNIVLTISGNSGSQYSIQSAESLLAPISWSPFTNITLTNSIQSIVLGPPTNLLQFFRALQQ
jgi:hypothetical protein